MEEEENCMHVHRGALHRRARATHHGCKKQSNNITCKETHQHISVRSETAHVSWSSISLPIAHLCVSCFVPIMQFLSIALEIEISFHYYFICFYGCTYSFISMKLYRCFRRRSVFVLEEWLEASWRVFVRSVFFLSHNDDDCDSYSKLSSLSQYARSTTRVTTTTTSSLVCFARDTKKKGQAPHRKVVNNCIRNETIILHNHLVISQ